MGSTSGVMVGSELFVTPECWVFLMLAVFLCVFGVSQSALVGIMVWCV